MSKKHNAAEAVYTPTEQEIDDVGEFPPQDKLAGGEPQGKPKYNPVRSWDQRYDLGVRYRVETDNRIGKIVIKFQLGAGELAPPPEVITIMRAAKVYEDGSPTGLEFRDTRLHGKAWLIPSDEAGRDLLAKIEAKLEELGATMVPAKATAKA
jgi:hypothetical protein